MFYKSSRGICRDGIKSIETRAAIIYSDKVTMDHVLEYCNIYGPTSGASCTFELYFW